MHRMAHTLTVCWIMVSNALVWGEPLSSLPDSVRFGPVRVSDSATDTLWLHNTLGTEWMVDSASVSGDTFRLCPSPFTGSPIRLGPDEALPLPIGFTPVDTITYTDCLDLFAEGAVRSIRVLGTGVMEVVVIDEIHADPAAGLVGDANGDGLRSSSEDEFVELLNTGSRSIDLSGWQLSDLGSGESRRFTFPRGALLDPGERVVLFGGGIPAGIPGASFVDDGKIGGGLSNSGDGVFLIDPTGPDTVARHIYGAEAAQDESVVRHPSGAGSFTRHSSRPGSGAKYSPGRSRVILHDISIDLPDTGLSVGSRVELRATGLFDDGTTQDLTHEVTWSVHGGHGELDGAWFTPAEPGSCLIVLDTGWNTSFRQSLVVSGPDPVGIRISPSETTVVVGDTLTLRAATLYPDTSVTPLPDRLLWSTVDSAVVLQVGDGLLVARRAGTSLVRASDSTLGDSAYVRVGVRGDLDADGSTGLWDAIRTVHLILGDAIGASLYEYRSADVNADGAIDIMDLVAIINRILGLPVGHPKIAAPGRGTWSFSGGALVVSVPAQLRCIQFDIADPAAVSWVYPDSGIEPDSVDVCVQQYTWPSGVTRVLVYTTGAEGLGSGDGQLVLSISAVEDGGNPWPEGFHAVDIRGRIVELESEQKGPGQILVDRITPNPFNAATLIRYTIPEAKRVRLRVFSVLGQEVAVLMDGPVLQGSHAVRWNGRDVTGQWCATGVYIALLETGQEHVARKMVLLR